MKNFLNKRLTTNEQREVNGSAGTWCQPYLQSGNYYTQGSGITACHFAVEACEDDQDAYPGYVLVGVVYNAIASKRICYFVRYSNPQDGGNGTCQFIC